jgi:hypothetical protein
MIDMHGWRFYCFMARGETMTVETKVDDSCKVIRMVGRSDDDGFGLFKI